MDQFSKNIISAIVASCVTTVIVVAVIFSFVANHPAWVVEHFGTATTTLAGTSVGDASVVETVKKVNPAVVSVIISKNIPSGSRFGASPFDPFGGLFGPPQSPNGNSQRQEIGGGSGFFVTGDGLIVTNEHVVNDPTAEYTVYTNDGKKHSAKVVAQDSSQDIALIKIEPQLGSPYPYLTFGESKNLVQGQTVIAIGNALGEFSNTVSVGVVSGLARSIVAGSVTGESEQLDEVIQTDAAINPGNSGGPLLDVGGKVVGVNVAVAVGSQSIGFALPADTVKAAVESVKAKGYISRPFLGVRYEPITETLQQQNRLPVNYGVLVTSGPDSNLPAVIPDSPAAKADIVKGDIILEFNGTKLTSDENLGTLVRSKQPGDKIQLKILHSGTQKTVTVTLSDLNKPS